MQEIKLGSITKHARVRYLNRILGINNITDINYDTWKKNNEDLINEIDSKINELFTNSDLMIEANYKTFPFSKFYINWENMMLLIVSRENNLVTLYKLNYGLSEEKNKTILKLYFDELQEKINLKYNIEKNRGKEKEEIDQEIKDINQNINVLKSRVEVLEKNKELLKNKKELIDSELNLIDEQIKELTNFIMKRSK